MVLTISMLIKVISWVSLVSPAMVATGPIPGNIINTNKAIYINNGELHISHYTKCTLIINKDLDNPLLIQLNSTEYSHNKYVFGLVDYECDNVIGTIMSKYDCKDCGMYCSYNQMFDQCKNNYLPLIFGVIISIITFVIMLLVIHKRYWKAIVATVDGMIYIHHARRVKKDYTTAKRMQNITGNSFPLTCAYSNISQFPRVEKRIATLVSKKDAKLSEKMAKNKSTEYIEPEKLKGPKSPQDKTNEFEPSAPNKSPTPPPRNKILKKEVWTPGLYPNIEAELGSATYGNHDKGNKKTSATTMALIALAATSAITPGDCCDNNLFINSLGEVCKNSDCVKVDMFTFPVQSGQMVCFNDVSGNKFTMKIVQSSIVTRYIKIYDTSDWEVIINSYYECKGAGQCWANGCAITTVGNRFTNVQVEASNGTGCLASGLGCDTTCWHQLSCTYYLWKITQLGDRFPVYKRENSGWEVVVETSYKDINKISVLNINNPSTGIIQHDSLAKSVVPLYVTNFMSEIIYPEENLILWKDKIIATRASNLNMPQSDLIGDFQISSNGESRSINLNDISCKVESCKVECAHPMPKMRKIEKLAQNYKDPSINYKRSDSDIIILSDRRVLGTATIMLGNLAIKNLQVSQARCQISVDYVYGCQACNRLPFIVFRATSIIGEGTMYFESNCTFDKNYLSCNREPFTLKASKLYDRCTIYLPTTNQTLTIGILYEYLGMVNPNDLIISRTSTLDELKEVVSSQSFWTGLLSTFTIFTSISVICSLILRGFKIYEIGKLNRAK